MLKSNKQLDLMKIVDHARIELVDEILDGLSLVDRDLICMVYGIGEYPLPYPTEYIAVEYNITRRAVNKRVQRILRSIVDDIKNEVKNNIINMQ
jgi:hypothetical protein